MPDLSFIDLYEHDGHLHQSTGSLTVDELLAQQERQGRALAADVVLHSIRAFSITPHRSRHGAPLADIASLQKAALVVLQSLRDDKSSARRKLWLHRKDAVHTLYFACDPERHAAQRLHGRSFAENLATWLRNARPEHTLVEVPVSEIASIDAMVREMNSYVEQMRESMSAFERTTESILAIAHAARATHAPHHPPAQTRAADSAAARRHAMSRDWPTAGEVSRQLGSTAANGSHRANQLRREGLLLGVWLPSEQAYRFPPWQFTADGQPLAQLQALLQELRGPGGMDTQDRLTSGWGEVEWLLTPHALLDGHSPAEVLPNDPARVLAVAQEEFREPVDARW